MVARRPGTFQPSARTQAKDNNVTMPSCRHVSTAISCSGRPRAIFSQRHNCTAKKKALTSSRPSPRPSPAPKAPGPMRSRLPRTARLMAAHVCPATCRPSAKLSRGTTTTVRLPSRAPAEAVVYFRPTACVKNPKKSHSDSSAAPGSNCGAAGERGVGAAGPEFISLPAAEEPGETLPTAMLAPRASVAMPKRRSMHKPESAVPDVP
mmetsp:Transcript_7200/g.19979  ORF Transcript_7200/g.19979 Transcript_7200/m.19979 type:complete len:207 (+) Transcript_7200:432-1052(+)